LNHNALVEVSNNAIFSNGARLFLNNEYRGFDREDESDFQDLLNNGARFATTGSRFTLLNASIIGNGVVGGINGVQLTQCDTWTEGQAAIAPGLFLNYDWNVAGTHDNFYGTLVFGDQLFMTGRVTPGDTELGIAPTRGVMTYIDYSSYRPRDEFGVIIPGEENTFNIKQDKIIVTRVSDGDAPIVAFLGGTLSVHARIIDYFPEESSFIVLRTIGDDATGEFIPGRILSLYDQLDIVPWRFFKGNEQFIVRFDDTEDPDYDPRGDVLRVVMERNMEVFEEAGRTWNEQQTGSGLDAI
jgi:hypothetical protein